MTTKSKTRGQRTTPTLSIGAYVKPVFADMKSKTKKHKVFSLFIDEPSFL